MSTFALKFSMLCTEIQPKPKVTAEIISSCLSYISSLAADTKALPPNARPNPIFNKLGWAHKKQSKLLSTTGEYQGISSLSLLMECRLFEGIQALVDQLTDINVVQSALITDGYDIAQKEMGEPKM